MERIKEVRSILSSAILYSPLSRESSPFAQRQILPQNVQKLQRQRTRYWNRNFSGRFRR
jgi:hypothetical protein